MNRQSFLATTAVFMTSSTAGCFSNESADSQCHLMHEVVAFPEKYGQVTETYRYEELSSDAQYVFEKALTNGSYSTTDRGLDSAQFRYRDTTTVYNITYQNETHVLLTYTGAGCETQQ